jgi:hypothetical protein
MLNSEEPIPSVYLHRSDPIGLTTGECSRTFCGLSADCAFPPDHIFQTKEPSMTTITTQGLGKVRLMGG